VAGDRPAVVGQEGVKRIHHDVVDVANDLHGTPWATGPREPD
jgi:hypothetical protein